MNAPEGHPQRGEVIAGKYVVEDVLGTGGMGVVVAARHVALRQRVAVKFLLPQAARIPEASARFLREAQAVVAIQSEHVARVLDVGTLASGAPYMVMEFLAGTDLAKRLKQGGPLPIPDAVDFVLQACEALAEAHALGIVHRDLKPANLFLTTRAEGSPLVKVLDFGLSKMAAEDGAPEGSLTATGFVMGSPQYMSPEQIRSLKHVDWRTDIWALGVILYELMTGKRPFDGPSLTAVSASIVADAPKPMRALRPDVPEAIDAAVLCCLEKDPARRWKSLGELAQALAPFAPSRSAPSVERILRLQPGTAAPAPAARPPAPSLSAVSVAVSAPAPMLGPASAPPSAPAPAPMLAPVPPPTQPSLPSGAIFAGAPTIHVNPTTAQSSAWGNTGPAQQGRTTLWIAAGLGTAAAVLGALVWIVRARTPESPSTPAATTMAVAEKSSPPPPVVAPVLTATATAASAPSSAPAAPAPSASAPSAKPAPSAPPPQVAPPKTATPAALKPPKRPNPLDRSN